jgi:hypothetical protein
MQANDVDCVCGCASVVCLQCGCRLGCVPPSTGQRERRRQPLHPAAIAACEHVRGDDHPHGQLERPPVRSRCARQCVCLGGV